VEKTREVVTFVTGGVSGGKAGHAREGKILEKG